MVVLVGPVSPFRGGIADTNNSFVKALIAQGEQVVVFSFSLLYPRALFPGKTQYVSSHSNTDFTVFREINMLNPLSWWKTAKHIKKLHPSVVLFRYWTPWLALCYRVIASTIKCKKIAWVDNALPHEKKVADMALLGTFLEGTDEVLCMSEKVTDELKKQTKKTIHTYFHPINTQLPKPMKKGDALVALGLDGAFEYILFFGLIRPYKGLDLLIKSLPQLKQKRPQTRVLIVGEPYEPLGKYRELASSLKVDDMLLFHDRFVPTNEVSMWFSVCDWVVQPYIAATQSGITPMAIHFNKPTVVTRVGGLAESIHSKTGMVSEANPTALSQVLCNALANTKSFSDKEAFDMLREEKSWHRFCQLFSSTFIKK